MFAWAYSNATLRSCGASLYARPRICSASADAPLAEASCPARKKARAASAQKAVVDSQRFGLVLWIDQQIKQQAVVNSRPVRLVHPCVEIAERLRGFLVLR